MLTRRTFIKGMGLAATTPWLAPTIQAVYGERRQKAGRPHHILTCNIRVALPDDDKAGYGWNDRKELCIDVIRSRKPDIIATQEVLKVQNEDLKKAFPGFFSFGFEGPEMDAFKEGYHGVAKNPIFFSTARYQLLAAGEYWLSETPLIGGSKSWGTARARHVNWVRLKEKSTGKDFRVVNTHLDHKSQEAREMQVKTIVTECAQYAPGYPQILTGDFNASASNPVFEIISEGNWEDTYTSIHGPSEPGYTAHRFEGENYAKKAEGKKIDFIFTRGGPKAVSAEIIKDYRNGRYPSDHYFVSAAVEL